MESRTVHAPICLPIVEETTTEVVPGLLKVGLSSKRLGRRDSGLVTGRIETEAFAHHPPAELPQQHIIRWLVLGCRSIRTRSKYCTV